MNNIFEKHISDVQKRFKKYNAMILKSKNDKEISDALIQTYIDARYYNFGTDSNIKPFYKRVFKALENKGLELVKKTPRKKETIDNALTIFQYYLYFDFVRNTDDLEKIVDSIADKRIFKLNMKSAIKEENFKEELLELVRDDIREVKEYLVSYGCKDFSLVTKKFSSDNNYINVGLNYFFDFPEIFSEEAIVDTFNTDIIAEDKLFVEYPLVAIEALKDILAGNFSTIYICDFAVSLVNKKTKINQVLECIENQAAQDKIIFRVNYREFLENKKGIFELVKKGFKFALKTYSDMPQLGNGELNVLEVFSCIIADEKDVNKNKYKNVKILKE